MKKYKSLLYSFVILLNFGSLQAAPPLDINFKMKKGRSVHFSTRKFREFGNKYSVYSRKWEGVLKVGGEDRAAECTISKGKEKEELTVSFKPKPSTQIFLPLSIKFNSTGKNDCWADIFYTSENGGSFIKTEELLESLPNGKKKLFYFIRLVRETGKELEVTKGGKTKTRTGDCSFPLMVPFMAAFEVKDGSLNCDLHDLRALPFNMFNASGIAPYFTGAPIPLEHDSTLRTELPKVIMDLQQKIEQAYKLQQ